MSSSPLPLSQRLLRLVDLSGVGETFWDIGCDHGLAGREVRRRGSFREVCFVDPAELVIQQLKHFIDSDIPSEIPYSIIQKNGDELTITANQNTFLMAGFGGKAINQTIDALLRQRSPSSQARFILSPHRDNLLVRATLAAGSFSLIHEEIFQENEQFYEIIVVECGQEAPGVSLYGEAQWRSPAGERRRQQLLKILPLHQNSTDKAFFEYLLKL